MAGGAVTLAVAVALAGGTGAVLRFLVDARVQSRRAGPFPWGTTTVNISGSFLLGVLAGIAWYHGLPAWLQPVVGTGLCGGLTTWSTASWESVRLVESGLYRHAFGHALGGLAAALVAAAAGIALAAI